MKKEIKKYKPWKVILLWLFGSIFALLASIIVSQAALEFTNFNPRAILILSVAFFLFLITGIFWISVAVVLRKPEE